MGDHEEYIHNKTIVMPGLVVSSGESQKKHLGMVFIKNGMATCYADIEESKSERLQEEVPSHHAEHTMNDQDRYIDARLDAIDGKLAARMDAMDVKFSERIDAMGVKFSERQDAMDVKFDEHIGALEKTADRIELSAKDFHNEIKSLKKQTWGAAATTIVAVVAIIALFAGFYFTTISEQGNWVRQNLDRQDSQQSKIVDTLNSIQQHLEQQSSKR